MDCPREETIEEMESLIVRIKDALERLESIVARLRQAHMAENLEDSIIQCPHAP